MRKLFRLVQLEEVAERIVQEGLVSGAGRGREPVHLDALLLQVGDRGIDVVDSDREVVRTERLGVGFYQVHLLAAGVKPVPRAKIGAGQLHRSHPLLTSLPDVLHLTARPGRNPELRAMVALLGEELENQPVGATAVTPSLVDALLVYMLRAWLRDAAQTAGWSAALADPVIARALAVIHEQPERSWTVNQLAATTGLSRAAFARRFTTLVGQPPLTYLTQWRMTIAARLLRETDIPVAQVASAIGYGSAFAFTKAFRREHDTTPGNYRATVSRP